MWRCGVRRVDARGPCRTTHTWNSWNGSRTDKTENKTIDAHNMHFICEWLIIFIDRFHLDASECARTGDNIMHRMKIRNRFVSPAREICVGQTYLYGFAFGSCTRPTCAVACRLTVFERTTIEKSGNTCNSHRPVIYEIQTIAYQRCMRILNYAMPDRQKSMGRRSEWNQLRFSIATFGDNKTRKLDA